MPAVPFVARTATILCGSAQLYLWDTFNAVPYRSKWAGSLSAGQHVTLISRVHATLSTFDLYETDIPVAEVGYAPNAHYWIFTDCVPPESAARKSRAQATISNDRSRAP